MISLTMGSLVKGNILIFLMLVISSLNCNGLRSHNKFQNIYNSVKCDVLCLQETHFNDDLVKKCELIIDGKMYCSNSPTGMQGVAIVIDKKLQSHVTSVRSDDVGRMVKVTLRIDDSEVHIINIYAPNLTNDRILFFQNLGNYISTDKTILVGDFNTVFSSIGRSSGRLENDKSRECLLKCMIDFNFKDIWRLRYPDRRVFTWRRHVNQTFRQSRIDYFLVSANILSNCKYVYINQTSFSDHAIISMKCDFSNVEMGPGLYCFNNTLLSDVDFCERVRTIITEQQKCPLFKLDIGIWWDNLKFKIKKYAQIFGEIRKKKQWEEINMIQRNLETEYRKAAINVNYDNTKIMELNDLLTCYETEKCNGAILRSKALWTHESDRNTKYFLNLEKSRQSKKIITNITVNGETTVSDSKDLLQAVFDFYANLFKHDDVDLEAQREVLNNLQCTLSKSDSESCELEIALDEIKCALDGMSCNKSPGNDGLTVEFYKCFWAELGHILHQVYSSVFNNCELTRTMKSGVITLIYKEKGDKSLLKNWRPISLLNVDYKIIARSMSNRLKTVVSTVVDSCQTCCIPGRDIADTICSLRDVIEYSENDDVETYLIKLDQEKAFDRVTHEYLLNVLSRFGFGPNFIRWINLFYTNLRSAVKCNGHVTKYFPVHKSIRQGCPISALLYVLSVEPFGALLRSRGDIRGVSIPGSETKCLIFQHADDTTITVTDRKSVKPVLDCANLYGKASNARINADKCEILPLCVETNDNIIEGLPVCKDAVCILGVYLGPNKTLCMEKNWSDKVNKIKKIVNIWKQRRLTLQGRVTVISALLLSRLWYTMMVLPVPEKYINDIKAICMDFVWCSRPALISYNCMINKLCFAGLKLPDIVTKVRAFRLKFLSRYFDQSYKAVWKSFFTYFLSKWFDLSLSIPLFYMSCEKSLIAVLPMYYKELMIAWAELQRVTRTSLKERKDILCQPVFFNPMVMVNGKTLFSKTFVQSKLFCLKDFLYEVIPGFLPNEAIVEIVQNHCTEVDSNRVLLLYELIKSAIPVEWIEVLNEETDNNMNDVMSIPDICVNGKVVSMVKCTSRKFYWALLQNIVKVPCSLAFWKTVYLNINFKDIWDPFVLSCKPPDYVQLDFKIAHNVIFTMQKLQKIAYSQTDICCLCKTDIENLPHLFVHCKELQHFLNFVGSHVETLFAFTHPSVLNNVDFSSLMLFGYKKINEKLSVNFLNLFLSCARLSIWKRRNLCLHENVVCDIKKLFITKLRNQLRLTKFYYESRQLQELFERRFVKNNLLVKINNKDELVINMCN